MDNTEMELLIEKENLLIEMITEWHSMCEEYGMDEDTIETQIIDTISNATGGKIELSR